MAWFGLALLFGVAYAYVKVRRKRKASHAQ